MPAYKTMTDDQAERYLRADRDEAVTFEDEYTSVMGDGEPLDAVVFESVKDALEAIIRSNPQVAKQGRPGLEHLGFEPLHRELSKLPLEALTDPGFWKWLAVTRFASLIEWRFGVSEGRANVNNYGVRKPQENMLYRMWIRGELGYQENCADPYELARFEDQDFWRSHIIRKGYGNVREVARALLRLQAGMLGRPKLSNPQIRILAKNIKRMRANMYLEFLTADQANALVVELCEGI